MDLFWFFILIPAIWPFIAKKFFHKSFTWTEVGINIGVIAIMVGTIWMMGKYHQLSDTEVWSGSVTNKTMRQESCPSGWVRFRDDFCTNYSTRSVKVGETCTTSSDGKRTCRPDYETEYNYTYDWERKWYVHSTLGEYMIARVDSQGAREPARWGEVRVGHPVAQERSYVNYIQAARHSLFSSESAFLKEYEDLIPEYPRVYDYYKIDRVQAVGVEVADLDAWNERLSEIQRVLGPEKQANVNIIFTSADSPNYLKALKAAWQGFEKNDVVIAVGLNGMDIVWADADSWSKYDLVNISLRDKIMEMKTLDMNKMLTTVEEEVMNNYVRRPMSEFEYLKDEIEPPMWLIVVVSIICLIFSPALTWFLNRPGVDIKII